ncbi:MAG: hypothetical protein GX335_04625 [Firmicutes bacterium]|nr:hypothetical protein [Bacillota bacterium]
MIKEIGSDFWLNRENIPYGKEVPLNFLGLKYLDAVLLSTGRSAISYVLDHIVSSKKTALLPPFTCYSVIEPFLNAGYEIHFYEIDERLECNAHHLTKLVKEQDPSVVLFHSYFGFNTLKSVRETVKLIRDMGVVVIEDITQTLYSKYNRLSADFYIGSFRKWGPHPDGGFAVSTSVTFKYKPEHVDLKLEEAKLKALHAKYLYMCEGKGEKTYFLQLFREAEEILKSQRGYYAMSEVSRKVQDNLHINTLRKTRKQNYQQLLEIAEDVNDLVEPVFGSLPPEITPLYFPVYVKGNRKVLQRLLAEQDIYCPIIWSKPKYCCGRVSETVNQIYDSILAIPCDQRYGANEMNRIGEVLFQLQKR